MVSAILRLPNANNIVEEALKEHAMHLACARDAPCDIIRSIFNLASDHVKHSVFVHQDDIGSTPLHWASLYACDETIHFLLNKGGENSKSRAYKLKDHRGQLPLHHILITKVNPTVIQHFLQLYPDALTSGDRYGVTPLVSFYSANETELYLLRRNNGNDFINIFEEGDNYLSNIVQCLFLFTAVIVAKRKIEDCDIEPILERTDGKIVNSAFGTLLVHQALQLENIPHIFICLLFDLFPIESIRRKDENGNGLLHILLSQKHCTLGLVQYVSSRLKCNDRNLEEDFNDGIVNVWTQTNNDGRIPLALAIQSGHSWQCGILQFIINESPDTINDIDEMTGLYPFMLATCNCKCHKDIDSNVDIETESTKNCSADNETGLLSLSVSYELLRMNPSLAQIQKYYTMMR